MPGVNVGRIGNFDPGAIAASGAKGVRCTYNPDVPVPQGQVWLNELQLRGLTTVMALDNDTNFWEAPQQWRNGVERARDAYRNYVDLWQIGNEPDAGYLDPNTDQALEGRAAAHPSSWVMSQAELTDRLWAAREILGQNATIVGPGLVSGHPEWAVDGGMDWSPVDFIACHPYAKTPGSPELLALIAAYSAIGWPVMVSEYDATSEGMHLWLAKNMAASYCYCWSREMNDEFGMIERPSAFIEFKAANAMEPPVVQPPDPPKEPTLAKYPELALVRYWKSIDPTIPFDIRPAPKGLGICRHWSEDPYKYGPPTGDEASDGNGNQVQLFAKRPIRWTPSGPEDVDP